MFTIYPNYFKAEIFEINEIYYSKFALCNITLLLFILSLIFGFKLFRSWKIAFTLSFIKSAFFFLFFFFFFNATNFNEIDSLTYIEGTKALVESVNSVDAFINFDNFRNYGQGHYFYYIYSFILCKIFGTYIFVPIAFNIISTYFGGYLIFQILKKFYKINNEVCKVLTIIFLLHWENIFWSSFFNLRDILIQTSILATTYLFIKFTTDDSKYKILNFGILLISFSILFILRVHIAIALFALFYFLYFFINGISSKKILGILLMSVVGFFYTSEFLNVVIKWLEFFDLGYGLKMLRYFFSPAPFTHLYGGYGYLILSTPLNIILFPFTIIGVIYLYNKNKITTLILFSVLLSITFIMSGYENVQGPRQRLMIIPFLYIFQSIGFLRAISHFKNTFNNKNQLN
ncbi:hypothetical protein [Polynucleobacter difficilis]|uniref:hypothetical protein n=1 Tax=Polynucleobacter difficilis TaxID=556054 RepID=UPI000D3D4EEE|nr:hypothetical protein [Polynucleobacter difficilis]